MVLCWNGRTGRGALMVLRGYGVTKFLKLPAAIDAAEDLGRAVLGLRHIVPISRYVVIVLLLPRGRLLPSLAVLLVERGHPAVRAVALPADVV